MPAQVQIWNIVGFQQWFASLKPKPVKQGLPILAQLTNASTCPSLVLSWLSYVGLPVTSQPCLNFGYPFWYSVWLPLQVHLWKCYGFHYRIACLIPRRDQPMLPILGPVTECQQRSSFVLVLACHNCFANLVTKLVPYWHTYLHLEQIDRQTPLLGQQWQSKPDLPQPCQQWPNFVLPALVSHGRARRGLHTGYVPTVCIIYILSLNTRLSQSF